MRLSTTLANILLLGGLVPASIHAFEVWDPPSTPLLPSHDAFYIDRPAGLEKYTPGELVRVRRAPGNLTTLLNCSAAWHLVFRTTDANDTPTWALTTLLAPFKPYRRASSACNASDERGTALLSYQAAYNTPSVDKSASVDLYSAEGDTTLKDVFSALNRGWFVCMPDFEGPLAAMFAGKMEGHAVLDGVSAVLALAAASPDLHNKLESVGLDPVATQFALWGYSGGSVASLWAAELQSSGYQSGLLSRFAGVAVGGMAPNPVSSFTLLEGTSWVGLVPLGLLGVTVQFPLERAYLLSRLKPATKARFLEAENMGPNDAVAFFANETIGDYFIGGDADIYDSVIARLFDRESVAGRHGTPRTPVFAYKAIGDEFTPVRDSDELIAKYCAAGANIRYERNTVGGHLSEFQNGHSRALGWLESLFNGTYGDVYQTRGCEVLNVTVVDPTGSFLGVDF